MDTHAQPATRAPENGERMMAEQQLINNADSGHTIDLGANGHVPAVDTELFRRGMRRLTAGVSLITTLEQGQRHGLVATSVCSLSAEPPSLLVCVNSTASSHEPMRRSGILCVNVLSQEDEPVAAKFASSLNRHERFADGDWLTLATGAPALARALVSFDCAIARQIPYQTHTIFICEILKVHMSEELASPLVYLDGRYRSLV